ncbi:unnamed protein product [Meganyctiphanes norvegica]|uniref:Uncharacterized protein n=1 Tax=Meganyctiphanes norvegica TaxID=48144 RepID=A0AAV2SHD0_MEGNR
MQMDTMHCGFHPAGPGQGLGVAAHGVPISPPATPTNEMSRTPEYSSCEDQYNNHHRYAQTDYHNTHYGVQDDPYGAPAFSPPESPQETPICSPDHSPMHLSTLPFDADNDTNSNYSTNSSRKSSTTSNKSSSSSSRNRKSSYVYDVRLTDEQFLFLVPDLDLVKSHLMFAVREEVEVLKEKITELMERINQLEYENTVLKQYATNEALQQIQQHHNSNT